MKYPFELEFSEIEAAPEPFVSAVFSSLASEFLTLPKGEGFVDYAAFETGYEALKKATRGFAALPRSEVLGTVLEVPIAFVVLRSMLGFSPPEWAYVAAQRHGSELTQGFARTLDRKIRVSPLSPLRPNAEMKKRIEAMVGTACDLLEEGCPKVQVHQIHRLQKADTVGGLIEAKLTEDDGTARDKVTRIQHLHSLSIAGHPRGRNKFEVVACIAGRGFGVRREDMKKLLIATRGKVFTPKTLDRLVDCTGLKNFGTNQTQTSD